MLRIYVRLATALLRCSEKGNVELALGKSGGSRMFVPIEVEDVDPRASFEARFSSCCNFMSHKTFSPILEDELVNITFVMTQPINHT